MSQRFIAVGAAVVCLALAASARADSIPARGSDIFSDGHVLFTTSCNVGCDDGSDFFSRPPLFFGFQPSSRRDSRNLIDLFAIGVLEKEFNNETRLHGRFHRFDPEPFPREREGSPPAAAVPEPNSRLLLSAGLVGVALLGASVRREPPVPPGAE
jgi:hypothetical protein